MITKKVWPDVGTFCVVVFKVGLFFVAFFWPIKAAKDD